MKLSYAVVVEQTPNNYAAYAPDVPGCVSTGRSWNEMLEMIREALAFHIEALLQDGEPMPMSRMSIEEAVAHHHGVTTCDRAGPCTEFGDPVATISTRFEMVEVEVPAPQSTQGC